MDGRVPYGYSNSTNSSASSVAVLIALLAFCCSSSSISALGAFLFKDKLFGGSDSPIPESELGKDSRKQRVKVTSPAPSTSKWYETNGDDPSVTHVGVVLARYTKDQVPDISGREKDPGWVSPFLANACHADSRCTGFQIDTEKGMAWLKDHDSVPNECLDDSHRCSDSDWKKGQGKYTYFHPDRGWKPKSDAVLNIIKELDCSSGSQCKLQQILGAVSWAIMGLSFIPFGEVVGMALTGASMAGRIAIVAAHSLEMGLDLAGISIDTASTVSAINASRKDASFPLDNKPVISIDDYWIGERYDQYYKSVLGAANTSLCYKAGIPSTSTGNTADALVGVYSQCTDAEKQRVGELLNERKARVYDQWKKAVSKWESLPESESNGGGFAWDSVYNDSSSLGFNIVQMKNGKVQYVLPKEAEAVLKREKEYRDTMYLSYAKSGKTRSSTRTTTAPQKTTSSKTSAPKMTPVPTKKTTSSSASKKSTPVPTKKW